MNDAGTSRREFDVLVHLSCRNVPVGALGKALISSGPGMAVNLELLESPFLCVQLPAVMLLRQRVHAKNELARTASTTIPALLKLLKLNVTSEEFSQSSMVVRRAAADALATLGSRTSDADFIAAERTASSHVYGCTLSVECQR
jgi:hypothetical protein